MCLTYLSEVSSGSNLALSQFEEAECMTDRLSAFNCILSTSHHSPEERAAVVKSFLDSAEGDALVVNKWFAAQAAADHPDALDHVS